MADEIRHTMSRRQRVRVAAERGTLGQMSVEELRAEYGFRVNAGLLPAPKGKKELTKAELIVALGGEVEAAPTTTGKE